MAEHKHAEVLRAIADGKYAEWRSYDDETWINMLTSSGTTYNPISRPEFEWRIKSWTKPDVVAFIGISPQISIDEIIKDKLQEGIWSLDAGHYIVNHCPHQLKLTFDGETGKLKSAEVI